MSMPDKIAIHNLFGVEGLDVAWYGILIACGIVLGVLVAIYEAKTQGIYFGAADRFYDFGIATVYCWSAYLLCGF